MLSFVSKRRIKMDWPQTLTIIGSLLILTMAGFAWMITRMDRSFEKLEETI